MRKSSIDQFEMVAKIWYDRFWKRQGLAVVVRKAPEHKWNSEAAK